MTVDYPLFLRNRLGISCLLILSVLLFQACEEVVYSPKPRAYPKVNYPEKTYQPFDKNYCNFSFEYPQYATIQQDTLFFDEQPNDPCWFDIIIPSLNAQIHCSYYPIDQDNSFDKLNKDAFDLAYKHNLKANSIEDFPIKKPDGTAGMAFNLVGDVASSFQFYLTDSTTHFLRGALYFNTQSNADSLAPVTDFVKTDIMHLINTFEWDKE